ncbi:macrodomain Ter protein organizer (MatP/YcbG family) [Shinella sp. BE166]
MRKTRKFSGPATGWGPETARRKICTHLTTELLQRVSDEAERRGQSISATIAALVQSGLSQSKGPEAWAIRI